MAFFYIFVIQPFFMKSYYRRIFSSLCFIAIPVFSIAQNIFSEKELEYKKSFLPYDVPYTFSLDDKEFIMLIEVKKSSMKLGRYDQYFFEKWEVDLELNINESAPQIFVLEDKICIYSITTNPDRQEVILTFRYFDINTGEELEGTNYLFGIEGREGFEPKIIFSKDKSKFAIYNYLVRKDGGEKAEFQIYNIGDKTSLEKYYLEPVDVGPSLSKNIHLSNEGDLYLVTVNVSEFRIESYYWGIRIKEVNQISNNYFFERPADDISKIDIIRQSSSSYFVSFAAHIEDELIGFNIASYNVVLKTVMFSHNQNLRKEVIDDLYHDFYITEDNQKKKNLEIPELLKDFRYSRSFVNAQNDIILMFENLEIPLEFHENETSNNMPWKHKSKEDKFYSGGDLLLYCFTQRGQEKWKKTIQRTQYSQASGLGLSFIGGIDEDQLRLLTYESSKGGSFYIMDINTSDGSLIKKINLIPERKFEFTKKYSCLLDANSVIICGIAPANIYKRSLMLVEF